MEKLKSLDPIVSRIDQTLNILINFKLKKFHVDTNANNNNIQVIDMNVIKMILEENPAVKNQRDSNILYQQLIKKELDRLISDLSIQFHENKKLQEDIMSLIERLKKSKGEDTDRQTHQEHLNQINKLENEDRIKMLALFMIEQNLNQRYKYLEIEKQKSIQAFTQDMVHTLNGLQTTDGKLLTGSQKIDLNKDLSQIEIDLVNKYIDKETIISERRGLGNIISLSSVRNEASQSPVYFLPTYSSVRSDQNVYDKIFSNPEFIQEHNKIVKDTIIAKNPKIDPGQLQTVADKRLEVLKENKNLKSVIEVQKKQEVVEKQINVVTNIKELYIKNEDKMQNAEFDFDMFNKINESKSNKTKSKL